MTVSAGEPRITVAIVDDHPMSAEGLATRLGAAGLAVIATAGDVESFVADTTRAAGPPPVAHPDVVVCDLRLPGLSLGQAVAHLVRDGHRVLATSGWASPDIVLEAVAHGARGYLPKENPTEQFAEAVREVARHGHHISVQLASHLRADVGCRPLGQDDLSRSERRILDACADGDRFGELAARMGMSQAGVRDSLARIFAAARQRRHDPRYRPTPREEEVMILAGCTGMSDRRIARQLGGLSEDTVTRHLSHLKEKYQRTHPEEAEAVRMSPRAIASQWARDFGRCPG
jgi:DNA-binding NarL/FixJ family response regulator